MNDNNQHFNLEQLNSFSFDDDEFKKELIEIFLGQIPVFISKMKEFLKADDFANLAREAHTAKSSVLIFGMTETGTSLKEIQSQSEKASAENLSTLIDKVAKEMNFVSVQLQVILDDL